MWRPKPSIKNQVNWKVDDKAYWKKIISGDLNLTRISFPIKAMVPKTALENSTLGCCTLPYFMKKACDT